MSSADIGVYGLGTMGSALALNFAEKGFTVAVTNRETPWIKRFVEESGALAGQFVPSDTVEEFVGSLKRPRIMLFMIPSGPPMDDMIARLRSMLEEGDTLIDGGNADSNDTRRRSSDLSGTGLHYVGMGVSGGAEGARHGPSMMVGGTDHSWQHMRPMAEAIAARYQGDPCVAHVGPDGAGHFVKTVHNGIEYADMQMIAEVYGLLRDGAGWEADRIAELFAEWSTGPLASFLVDVTAQALQAVDTQTGLPMVDVILDRAGQKGTGRWTVIEALKLGQSASTIEAAVGARAWSAEKDVRVVAADRLVGATRAWTMPETSVLMRALLAGRILSHAQGFRIMDQASDAFDWQMNLARIAEIWRAGCIIRSDLLNDIAAVYRHAPPPEGHLVLAPTFRAMLAENIGALRQVVAGALERGLPVPSLAAGLGWYDSLRQARGSTNLIQAQRDIFGAHGFARLDKDGMFHGDW